MTASSPSATIRPRARGFTLTELAVVFTIVALLMAGLMYTLSAQMEQRDRNETARRLDEAKELLVAFALVNGRLPCPARYVDLATHSGGLESFCTAGAPATCTVPADITTTVQAHGNCSNYYDGYLPATSIGYGGADSAGFAVDAWGNRLRYAVAKKMNDPGMTCPVAGAAMSEPGFTNATNLKNNGIACLPDEMVVCASSTGVTGTTCGTATPVTNTRVLAAVLLSTGKNFATAATAAAAAAAGRTDEAQNLNGDGVFVFHTPAPEGANQFDDQVIWIPAPVLYSRMVAAGMLP